MSLNGDLGRRQRKMDGKPSPAHSCPTLIQSAELPNREDIHRRYTQLLKQRRRLKVRGSCSRMLSSISRPLESALVPLQDLKRPLAPDPGVPEMKESSISLPAPPPPGVMRSAPRPQQPQPHLLEASRSLALSPPRPPPASSVRAVFGRLQTLRQLTTFATLLQPPSPPVSPISPAKTPQARPRPASASVSLVQRLPPQQQEPDDQEESHMFIEPLLEELPRPPLALPERAPPPKVPDLNDKQFKVSNGRPASSLGI
jgi:hypothetical protein